MPFLRLASLAFSLLVCLAVSGGSAAGGEDSFPPWAGREENIESALQLGEVVAKERVGHGITNPWKVTLEHQGETLTAVWKPLPEREQSGWEESYRAEVAAYRLSRSLALDMVPPTVLRLVRGHAGSMQLWVDDCRLYRDAAAGARPPLRLWSEQVARMRFFDALIDNPDRNAGNFLIDQHWRLVLIDHSRALALPAIVLPRPQRDAPPVPTRFDRELLAGARALDLPALDALLGDLYSKAELRTLLRQRDTLVRAADTALAQFGESALFERPRLVLGAETVPP
jgi:hypothetical protein